MSICLSLLIPLYSAVSFNLLLFSFVTSLVIDHEVYSPYFGKSPAVSPLFSNLTNYLFSFPFVCHNLISLVTDTLLTHHLIHNRTSHVLFGTHGNGTAKRDIFLIPTYAIKKLLSCTQHVKMEIRNADHKVNVQGHRSLVNGEWTWWFGVKAGTLMMLAIAMKTWSLNSRSLLLPLLRGEQTSTCGDGRKRVFQSPGHSIGWTDLTSWVKFDLSIWYWYFQLEN